MMITIKNNIQKRENENIENTIKTYNVYIGIQSKFTMFISYLSIISSINIMQYTLFIVMGKVRFNRQSLAHCI